MSKTLEQIIREMLEARGDVNNITLFVDGKQVSVIVMIEEVRE